MTGAEAQVLKIIKELKQVDEKTISRKMAVTSGYVIELCEGLISDGYLRKSGKGYSLTPEGMQAINPVKVRGPIQVLKGGL